MKITEVFQLYIMEGDNNYMKLGMFDHTGFWPTAFILLSKKSLANNHKMETYYKSLLMHSRQKLKEQPMFVILNEVEWKVVICKLKVPSSRSPLIHSIKKELY